MKKIILLAGMCFPMLVMAQNVGIGTTAPIAKLDIRNLENTNALNINNLGNLTGIFLGQTNTTSTAPGIDIDYRGRGPALYLTSTNSLANQSALYVTNSGLSRAVYIHQQNISTAEPALYVNNSGIGPAIHTTGEVLIGTAAPSFRSQLSVFGNSDFFAPSFQAHFTELDNDYARIGFGNNNGTSWHLAAYSNAISENARFNIYSVNANADVLSLNGEGDMTLRRAFKPGGSAGTTGQILTSKGSNTAPAWESPLLQAAFRVITNGTQFLPQSPDRLSVNFGNIIVNDNLYWSSLYQAYFANNTGLYQFNINLHFSLNILPGTPGPYDNQVFIYLNVNGTLVHLGSLSIVPTQIYNPFVYDYNFSTLLPLNINDQVSIQCTRAGGIPGSGFLSLTGSSFSGYRVK
jgi:hypothetical protein